MNRRTSVIIVFAMMTMCSIEGSTLNAQMGASQSPAKTAREQFTIEKEKLNELNAAFQISNQQYQMFKDRFTKVRAQTIEIGAAPESFPEILKTLQIQKIQLLIDIAGLDVRYKSLQDMATAAAAKVKTSEGKDAFARLVEVQLQRLSDAKNRRDSGAVSVDEYRKVEIDYLSARIRLADAQKPVQPIGPVNNVMMEVGLDLAEKRARLEKVESLLDQMTGATNLLEEHIVLQRKLEWSRQSKENFEAKIGFAKERLTRLQNALNEVEDETID